MKDDLKKIVNTCLRNKSKQFGFYTSCNDYICGLTKTDEDVQYFDDIEKHELFEKIGCPYLSRQVYLVDGMCCLGCDYYNKTKEIFEELYD